MEAQAQLDDIRLRRKKRFAAAQFFLSHDRSPAREPSWEELLALPYWCYWKSEERQRLILVCGALLVLPAMRLWIDGKKIKRSRELLGERIYERVMQSTALAKQPGIQVECDEVSDFLLSSGAAVLLSALDTEIADLVRPALPDAAGSLPGEVAQKIQAEAGDILITGREALDAVSGDGPVDKNTRMEESA